MPRVNDLTTVTNSVGESIVEKAGEFFTTMDSTLNAMGDFVTFGSNDRRQGYLGLVLGPIYDAMWQNLSVIITTMLGMEIGNYCNFNDRMYGYMTRLMLINLWEHNTTLAMLCESGSNQANGNSQSITHEALIPPYTKGNNYLKTARDIIAGEDAGKNATSVERIGNPYMTVTNLFPDDNDQRQNDFTNGDAWETTDPNSILYKTKCLFKQRKINTLISRFGTNTDPNPEPTQIPEEGNARTRYGLSHGRNLLKKKAEEGGIDQQGYKKNGYNNPYCRVWTHHSQYDKFKETMRPFENTHENVSNSHNWGDKFKTDKGFKTDYRWKSNARWEKTVLNGRGDGLINITPHFNGGGEKNIHSKDCMFSIENLAWKDYDPYSFETALSWEQRGPLGGRIMWFPPYGLTFNETSQAQWNANTFIGRGEDVYTYVNTKRTGTLQFYLIVDHPSILDYVSWYEANRDLVKDTDILRYFAGCDPNNPDDSNSLLHYVQPTPLTDEGVRGNKKGIVKKEWKPKDPPTAATPEEVKFIVYFPNNYSGMFDADDENDKGASGLGVYFVIEYLLAGTNAQIKSVINNDEIGTPEVKNFVEVTDMNGPGYEMEGGGGISEHTGDTDKTDDPNRQVFDGIVGNNYQWYVPDNNRGAKKYKPNTEKIWRYRTDGTFEVPTKKPSNGAQYKTNPLNNIYSNTYDQSPANTSYIDGKSYQLNVSLKNQTGNYPDGIPDNAYTFAEVAQAIAEISEGENNKLLKDFFSKSNRNINNSEEHKKKIETLKKLFGDSIKSDETKLKLNSISFQGLSNSQGINKSTTINKKRNEILAKGRAYTIAKWLKSSIPQWKDIEPSFSISEHKKAGTGDANALTAKLYRSAICTLSFLRDTTVDVEEMDDDTEKFVKLENQTFGGKDLYRLLNDDGSKWVKLDDGTLAKIEEDQNIADYADEQFWLDVMNGKDDNGKQLTTDDASKDTLYNQIRYDQEYHFFRRVKEETPLIYEKLMDKIKYFDPAFHSMTPEGFNARCTFLNQCTRQGNTVGVSDKNRLSASNMAFGRPPFCVLRLGDFYNQLIVIDSVNIQYDTSGGVVWDLNDEGVGVQPMLAQVSLNFTFIGGGSLDGPIRRLQNAMSFNFYANSELYDNRSDQSVYEYDRSLTMGGGGRGNLNIGETKTRNVEMYDPEKLN